MAAALFPIRKDAHWKLVAADGSVLCIFGKTEFRNAMGEAASLRTQGIVCDVSKIKEGR